MIHFFTQFDPTLHKSTVHWFFGFTQELIISTIGGFVGGALAYGWYIERKEARKNEAAKKTACTKALLTTQMVLLFQIQELQELNGWPCRWPCRAMAVPGAPFVPFVFFMFVDNMKMVKDFLKRHWQSKDFLKCLRKKGRLFFVEMLLVG